MSWFIRVTRSYDEIQEWVDNIEADRKAVYEHTADDEVSRTHIHMLLVNSKCKPDALKARFKKAYGEIDKGDWSFKRAGIDMSNTITYMSKGVLAPKLTYGFTVEEITKLTSEWRDPQINLKLENGKLVRDINESGKKTKREMLEQMRSRLSDSDSTRDILRTVRKVLMDNNQVIGDWKCQEYVDSLMMYDRKEAWLNMMERKINSKYDI